MRKLVTALLLCTLLAGCAPFRLVRPTTTAPIAAPAKSKISRYALYYLVFGGIGVLLTTAGGGLGGAAGKTEGTTQQVLGYTAIGCGALGAAATMLAGAFASFWSKAQ